MKNIQITSMNHRKGYTTEAYMGKATAGKVKLNVTFNCMTGDIIIDKWYLFNEDELAEIAAELAAFFAQLVA